MSYIIINRIYTIFNKNLKNNYYYFTSTRVKVYIAIMFYNLIKIDNFKKNIFSKPLIFLNIKNRDFLITTIFFINYSLILMLKPTKVFCY